MAKKIKLLNANFRSWSGKFGGDALTTVHISAPFEQLVAEQLGVKERVYARKKDEDDPDVRGFDLGIDWYGPGLNFLPVQGTLDGKVKTDKGVFIRPLRLTAVTIKRHKDDEQMLVSFAVTMLDGDAEMHQLLHAVKKSPINIEITPPSKAAAKQAEDQLRLISREQAEDTAEEND
jgi:hypothetical protein